MFISPYTASAGGRVRTGLRRVSAHSAGIKAHSARLALQQFPLDSAQAHADIEEVIQGTLCESCTRALCLCWLPSLEWTCLNHELQILLNVKSCTIFNSRTHKMSRVMRKPTFCICENKDADQLRGNREADQRFCFRYIDSTIPLFSKSKISSL